MQTLSELTDEERAAYLANEPHARWQAEFDAAYQRKAERDNAELMARLDRQFAPNPRPPPAKSQDQLDREARERQVWLTKCAAENARFAETQRLLIERARAEKRAALERELGSL